MRKNHIKAPGRIQGMAISMIILACFLLGSIAAAVALGSKAGIGSSETNKQQLLAGTILDQAATISNAFNAYYAKFGCNPVWMAIDPTNPNTDCNIYNPAYGTTAVQQPPSSAFISSTNAQWVYKVNPYGSTYNGSPNVKMMNVGWSNDGAYLIAVAGLTQGVCQQINQMVLGSTAIPTPATGTLSDWSTPGTAIDLSADTAVNGIYAQCIKTTDGGYVFYNVMWTT